MGRDRSWVVRITTAECAVELCCSAGGFCCVALLCGFAVGCEDSEDTGFCPLRIMWCAPEQQEYMDYFIWHVVYRIACHISIYHIWTLCCCQ